MLNEIATTEQVEEAQKNLLRTHTTAVSARMLYRLAQDGFRPVKYFSIDRVFRNESLDATHLAEFHQVATPAVSFFRCTASTLYPLRQLDEWKLMAFQIEGVVADYGLTLGHLIGILYEFFRKLGIEQLRFKPAYNPYTEPSMEVFSYHPGLAKWVEVKSTRFSRKMAALRFLFFSSRLVLIADWKLGHFPAGNVAAHGPTRGRVGHRLGPQFGTVMASLTEFR